MRRRPASSSPARSARACGSALVQLGTAGASSTTTRRGRGRDHDRSPRTPTAAARPRAARRPGGPADRAACAPPTWRCASSASRGRPATASSGSRSAIPGRGLPHLRLSRGAVPRPTPARRCRPTRSATTTDLFGTTPVVAIVLAPGATASFRLGVTHGRRHGRVHDRRRIAGRSRPTTRRPCVPDRQGAYECGTATVSPLRPGTSAYL